MSRQMKADISLLLVTIIWGSTFVLVKRAIEDMPPFLFIALRFTIAFVFLSILFYRKFRRTTHQTLWFGFLISLSMFGGYALQTIGLQFTTASKSGFLTGLSVVLVPLFTVLFFKKKVPSMVVVGIVMATIGLFLLSFDGRFAFNIGDGYSFLCAVSFAIFILQVDQYTQQVDSILLTIFQIGFVALFSGISSVLTELSRYNSIAFTWNVWIGLIVTGLLATALAYVIQNMVQNFTTPSHTGLIFSGEPVFSAVFAYFLMGETLSPHGIGGAALILIGTLLSEVKPSWPFLKSFFSSLHKAYSEE